MNVKILKLSLIALSILTLSSCSKPEPEIRYIDKPYEVKVPVRCVISNAECDFNRTTYTGVISSMLECIVDMKHNEGVCK